jgi:hypothetical protein
MIFLSPYYFENSRALSVMQHSSIALGWLHHLLRSSLEGLVALAKREPNIPVMVALVVGVCVEEATARYGRHASIVDQVRHKIYLHCTAQRDVLKYLRFSTPLVTSKAFH